MSNLFREDGPGPDTGSAWDGNDPIQWTWTKRFFVFGFTALALCACLLILAVLAALTYALWAWAVHR